MLPDSTVRVLFFAKAREFVGISEASLTVPSSVRDEKGLRDFIFSTFSLLRPLEQSTILAINEVYLHPGASVDLKQGDEIAVIPPISGG